MNQFYQPIFANHCPDATLLESDKQILSLDVWQVSLFLLKFAKQCHPLPLANVSTLDSPSIEDIGQWDVARLLSNWQETLQIVPIHGHVISCCSCSLGHFVKYMPLQQWMRLITQRLHSYVCRLASWQQGLILRCRLGPCPIANHSLNLLQLCLESHRVDVDFVPMACDVLLQITGANRTWRYSLWSRLHARSEHWLCS